MTFNLRTSTFSRCIYITSRRYCDKKSIYQQDEEGKLPQTVHGKPYPEWRKPWIQRENEWSSKLSLFTRKNPSPEIMNALQRLPYMDVQTVKDWWNSMKVVQEIQNQKYLPERVSALGSNLAALHFFTYRHCAVRLKDSKDWICGDITTLTLPDTFTDGYFVEAVDCTNFHHNGIRYEGIQNLSGLNFLKWLSLKNNKYIDVWCLDRLAGQNGKSLEHLDLTGCTLTASCVYALARMESLKMLIITDPGDDVTIQAALSTLELEKPGLLIKAVAIDNKSDIGNTTPEGVIK